MAGCGPSHGRWNDDRMIASNGYVKLRVGVEHPLADPNGYAASRAIRRRRQGHRQNIRFIERPRLDALRVGNKIIVHPEVARELRRQLAEEIDRDIGKALFGR